MKKIITTSWDDGHETDLRLAELLHKHNLKGTFYVPKTNAERPVMKVSQLVELAKGFEIGGHTLRHMRLQKVAAETMQQEIGGSFKWLCDLLGQRPVSFCFPGGVYSQQSINIAYSCGYKVLRTTEWHNTKRVFGSSLLATTVQLYQHTRVTHVKHLLKRRQWQNLLRWMIFSSEKDIGKLASFYLKQVEANDGCFHLWGHSWEIEKYNLWKKVEEVFTAISNRNAFSYVENQHAVQ